MKKQWTERLWGKLAPLAGLLGLGGLLISPVTAGEVPPAEGVSPPSETVVPDASQETEKAPTLGSTEATPIRQPMSPTTSEETTEKVPVSSSPVREPINEQQTVPSPETQLKENDSTIPQDGLEKTSPRDLLKPASAEELSENVSEKDPETDYRPVHDLKP